MKTSFKNRRFPVHPKVNCLRFVEVNDIEHYLSFWSIYLTCAVKSITGVSRITAAMKTVRYVGTSGKLTASSVVLSAFIHICIIVHTVYCDMVSDPTNF